MLRIMLYFKKCLTFNQLYFSQISSKYLRCPQYGTRFQINAGTISQGKFVHVACIGFKYLPCNLVFNILVPQNGKENNGTNTGKHQDYGCYPQKGRKKRRR